MSRPRGRSVQRKLTDLAKSILEPYGCKLEVDFSRRGGHQKLLVTFPDSDGTVPIELPSSPRVEHNAFDFMRQRCQRIIRERFAA